MPVDPRLAYHLPGARILTLVRTSDGSTYLDEIRRALAGYLSTREGRTAESWQDAWNRLTGATPGHTGTLRLTTARCTTCRGRRVTHRHAARNLARTGNPHVCGDCIGTGRGRTLVLTTSYAAPPTTETIHPATTT